MVNTPIRKNKIMTKKKKVSESPSRIKNIILEKKKGKISDKVKTKVAPKKKINVAKSKSSPKVCHKVCPKACPKVSWFRRILRFLFRSK